MMMAIYLKRQARNKMKMMEVKEYKEEHAKVMETETYGKEKIIKKRRIVIQ